MRNLWRDTTSLSWQYPILWLPAIVTEAITLCLSHLRVVLQKLASNQLLHSRSVFGGQPYYDLNHTAIVQTELLSLCLIAITSFLGGILLIGAMMLIAAMLRNLAATGQTRLAAAAESLRPDLGRILTFSLMLFAVAFAVGVVASTIVLLPASLLSAKHLLGNPFIGPLQLLLSGTVTAYLIAPTAIQLLRPAGSAPASPQEAHLARIAAICTIIASTTIAFLLHTAEGPSHIVQLPIQWINAEIAGLPYIPLFIAFYLIATPDTPLATPPTAQLEQET